MPEVDISDVSLGDDVGDFVIAPFVPALTFEEFAQQKETVLAFYQKVRSLGLRTPDALLRI